ncbi:dipeptide/oligopeptide/nickel ABC transporter permease/ATP-binding protein [Rathayibacter sp. Leaf296]|uniref:dipeptide/oligopeptide/nickel ABC transporter permease/ATP-binding protein n=1 Tax=Rathayibacter sp. Leaf296 TaxID=1736327 RepID=UPI00070304DB|nr:dipeptide/oligopeptide/nickel ABC transporter permease/ATP-binding protein [Rathayibacter sp. Leaf296]KQQ08489.1 hypothetical protein ASF46_14415 [Rathayibacter sp. Leaf296]
MTATVVPESRVAIASASRTSLRGFLRRPLAVTAIAVLLLIVVGSAGAGLLAPYDPFAQELLNATQPPSAAHLLGTDTLGRDVLSRLLWGGQPALAAAAVASATFGLLGIAMGLLAGYSRGAVDRLISLVIDILMSLPGLVLMFAVLAVFRNNLFAAMTALGLLSSGGLARVVRASTKSTREELYVKAAQVSGLSSGRIMLRHVLPRLTGPIIVQISLFVGIALVVQAGLGFLNLGVQAPAPTWGGMVAEAAQVITQFPWLLVPSGGIVAVTVVACGLIGDAVRDVNAETKSRSGGIRARRRRSRAVPGGVDESSPLISVKGLTISFATSGGAREVVHGIDFDVAGGEFVALVGESGSGKTITALSLLGLLPDNAIVDAERVRIAGRDFTGQPSASFRPLRGSVIGLVSQEPQVALDPAFTVGAQLREVIRAQGGLKGRAIRSRALELLAAVRLPDPEEIERRFPHQLSGGIAQRVVIAIALAGNPDLLIADEPTTALDVTVQSEILDLLLQLREEFGMAILLVTHDLGVVADCCERALVMEHGLIVERSDVVSLFARPEHPYTQSLIAATPRLLDSEPTAIDGEATA